MAGGAAAWTRAGRQTAGSLFGVQNLALLPNAIDPHHLLSSFGLLGC